ncbi:hypothetical protein CEP52_004010 [Fusarium oligoseptatum]|uniref:Uncharacterized protein n=1 Tax=Fusarium oligoseptatum TaxID=2604345 RepID=A0A428U5X8_9HYPO|nr:hypothetical protein CEP52_004010 [Fusarium oligoseptatum]
MINDLSWIHGGRDVCLSGLILAAANGFKSNDGSNGTRETLPAHERVSNHCGAYARINPESSFLLMPVAKQSHNPFFHQNSEKRAAEQDIDIKHFSN